MQIVVALIAYIVFAALVSWGRLRDFTELGDYGSAFGALVFDGLIFCVIHFIVMYIVRDLIGVKTADPTHTRMVYLSAFVSTMLLVAYYGAKPV